MANPVIQHASVEVRIGDWSLCFQKVTYTYDDPQRQSEDGFRFMWKSPEGRLKTDRGQARIPTEADLFTLLRLAADDGWFDLSSAAGILRLKP